VTRIVVVAPLREGMRESARLLIEEGPPFDPAGTALTRHEVYLTDREAVFVFEGPDAKAVVETLVGDSDVWKTAAAWKECLAGRPRLAEPAYSWLSDGAA
jgi:hypothetical protein